MSVCARGVPQPDGTVLLALDPATTNLTTCQYVVETSMSNWAELGNLSIDDAQVIGAHVALVWATAWAFRAIAKSLS